MKKLLLLLPFLLGTTMAEPSADDFCRWVEKGQMNKVEKAIKQQIHRYRSGEQVPTSSGDSYTTHGGVLNLIEGWLNDKPCVEATWDKCEVKIALFPGHARLGARYNNGQELCYNVQLGKTRSINKWLGWLHYFPESNKMIYQGSSVCDGFVDYQRGLCAMEENMHRDEIHNE